MHTTDLARRRRTPSQARSRETVEAICAAASAILEEEGITGLSTNAVAARAGVSISSIYAYFPDKWAIVHELFERFERLRNDALVVLFEDLRTASDWRAVMDRAWDELAAFRIEVPGGAALRRALPSSPVLAELDRQGSERAARSFRSVLDARRPDLDPDVAERVAWAATITAATLLDDSIRDGAVDTLVLAEGKRLIQAYLALYFDPPG